MGNTPKKVIIVNQFEAQNKNVKSGWQVTISSNNSSSNTKK